ncbi:MAG TPA: hypothetical protein VF832_07055 [Longimicrobiales bacterium]
MRAALTLLVAAILACGRSPSPPPGGLEVPIRDSGAPLQTDSLRYALAESGPGPARLPLVFSYANTGADTIYHLDCTSWLNPMLERKEGARWVEARYAVAPPCLRVVAVPPGAVRRDTLQLCRPTSPAQSSCQPWKVDGIGGIYRLKLNALRVHYDAGTGGGDTLPETRRISNSFLITSLK